jgi:HJR/Mrr/RecB family endonuclease
MPSHSSSAPIDNEAQLELLVAALFRAKGWKVLPQPRKENFAPDLIVSRAGKKLVAEVKRASEGRRDRIIPLLSQAALEASHFSRNLAGNPAPVILGPWA